MPPDKEHEPRWKIIDKLYNKVDKVLDNAFVDNKCSFLEVEITMLMIEEKLSQQKHELYSMYLEQKAKDKVDEDDEDEESDVKDAPENLYG